MSPERWQLVSDLFTEASPLSAEDRCALLNRKCSGDRELRQEVESLLAHRREADSLFDDAPPKQILADERGDFADWAGRSLGPYRLKRLLSAGGMGVVFLAEQQNPRRDVAIKMLHRGLLFGGARRRFEFESQILGRLRHPCIAEIYEAGRAPLSPPPQNGPAAPMHFFAMEYVESGQTLIDYAKAHELSLRDRLRLFVRVCDGVHHGHQKGVIHRDLKPSNILVTTEETSGGERIPAPKIIDFGVAKCTDGDVAVTTMQTTAGDLIGTLQYMSPEQCAADAAEIDTRADVYALGVVLYELLTDRLPYDVSNQSILTATRVINEAIQTPASHFDRRLRGELDIILGKALEKDRDKRYGSAAEFANDVRRNLNGEPIDARPPSRWRKSARWIGGHPFASSVMASVVIAGLIIGSAFGARSFLAGIPSGIELTSDKKTAALVSETGKTMATWHSGSRKGFSLAGYENVGDRKLVILGERRDILNPLAGYLRVFETGNTGSPLWEDHPTDDDMPQAMADMNRNADLLNPDHYYIADIFDEPEGSELVVTYKLGDHSQQCIRIFNMSNGNLLFQTWQDGGLLDIHWLSKPRLLVVLANDEGYKHMVGDDRSPAIVVPAVLFAIRLQRGYRGTEFVGRKSGIRIEDPVWYKYFDKDAFDGRINILELVEPDTGYDPCCYIGFRCELKSEGMPPGWDCIIDSQGNIVSGTMHQSDSYSLTRQQDPDLLPDLSNIGLDDTPSFPTKTSK